MDDYTLSILANMGMLSFLALSAYVLLIAGEVSFGQQAFFAVGGYSAGLATTLGALSLLPALLLAAIAGVLAAAALGFVVLRRRGLFFSISTLAAAEAIRLSLELFRFRVKAEGGEEIGPDGTAGLSGIRYIFDHGTTQGEFVLLVYGLLALVLIVLQLCERRRFGIAVRMVGEDPELATALGIDVARIRLCTMAAAGGIAAIGGALYAHYNTHIEPSNFGVMLGIHGVAYALIGGLGAPFGPLLGVVVDILLLESSRIFHGYRMIAFGGFVAVLLILRPRGLLDEQLFAWLRATIRLPGRIFFPAMASNEEQSRW